MKEEIGKMEYRSSGFHKYSNKLLPMYDKTSWTVWKSDKEGVLFHNFENANIFSELLKLKELIKKKEVNGE